MCALSVTERRGYQSCCKAANHVYQTYISVSLIIVAVEAVDVVGTTSKLRQLH